MKASVVLSSVICLAWISAPGWTADPPDHSAAAATATIADANGKQVGEAKLTETTQGVLVRLDLAGLSAGTRAFHIHETGECEGEFQSAGAHFNPTGETHGFFGRKRGHLGDLPNLHIPEGGKLTVEILATGVTLKAGEHSLLDADGSALVIHAGADDYRTDPAGDAGSRIACGVIRRSGSARASAR